MKKNIPVYMQRARRSHKYMEWAMLAVIVIIIAIAGRYVLGPFIFWIAEMVT